MASPALFGGGMLLGAVLAARHHAELEAAERERGYDAPAPIIIVQRIEPARTAESAPPPPAPPPPPPFDALAARRALTEVDATSCREAGAPRGYGHAKVTFNPSGDISKVVIDEPAALPAAAAKCVGDALGRATIPLFSGSLVTVGTTWFVP